MYNRGKENYVNSFLLWRKVTGTGIIAKREEIQPELFPSISASRERKFIEAIKVLP
jgi:hypothetical protein